MKRLLEALQTERNEWTIDRVAAVDWAKTDPDPQGPSAGGSTGVAADQRPSGQDRPSIPFHPNAAANFDSQAEALLAAIASRRLAPQPAAPIRTGPESEEIAPRLPPKVLDASDILWRDGDGIPTARYFRREDIHTGLDNDGYRNLRGLAEQMQQRRELRNCASIETLEDLIFGWLRERLLHSNPAKMSEYVLPRIAEAIGRYEVMLPLFHVSLPEPVQIGRVTLRTITAADFRRWVAPVPQAWWGQRPRDVPPTLIEERARYQGFAGAFLMLEGEPKRLIEIAQQEAEEAASLLRLFSPAIFSPRARSLCVLYGRENLPSTRYLLANDRSYSDGLDFEIETYPVWRITPERLQLIREEGLEPLLQHLFTAKSTAFAKDVRSALVFYSESATKSTPAEKLLAILIPVESILLRDDKESITDNVSFRLAWAIGETYEERKDVMRVAKDAYALRSAYVHHRRPIEHLKDLEVVRQFMMYAWRFFLKLSREAQRYAEQSAYLAQFDAFKLGKVPDEAEADE